MPGLVPGIHVHCAAWKAWMAATSPAMTLWRRLTIAKCDSLAPEWCGSADTPAKCKHAMFVPIESGKDNVIARCGREPQICP